ncbi:MAG: L-histidine N(alpha)-methyltransferase [Bacteroidota bacterium]
MQKDIAEKATSEFAKEVREGLTSFPKYLSSKYFYDEQGDALFQDIMAMPEYYLTDAEFEILETQKERITSYFSGQKEPFDLFELGAGDGKKTKILLKHLSRNGYNFEYLPVDISRNALEQLEKSLLSELPSLKINALQGTYFDILKDIGREKGRKKVILFLGSNIGNLLHPNAISFLRQLKEIMGPNDLMFMGMDQKKKPQIILDAYNDKAGITEAFNKNVLKRINTELGGNFDVDTFLHWEVYDPESGTAKSYLVSKKKQEIHIDALDLKVNFNPWETIHTEISQKYDDKTVRWLAKESGLEIVTSFEENKKLFKDYLLKRTTL